MKIENFIHSSKQIKNHYEKDVVCFYCPVAISCCSDDSDNLSPRVDEDPQVIKLSANVKDPVITRS